MSHMSQLRQKPTMGFEPMTPALRERCSGQLSYVGVGGECSQGRGFSSHGFWVRDTCCAWVPGASDRARVVALAEGCRAAITPLSFSPYLRYALSAGPLLARRRRRHRARRPRHPALAGRALPGRALRRRGARLGLAGRADEAAQPQRERGQRQVLLDVELQRLARVLAELGCPAQAAWVARLRCGHQRVDAVGREDRLGRSLGHADEVAERERRKLQPELQHVRPRATTGALRRLVELLLERTPLAVLRLHLQATLLLLVE